MKLFRFGEAGHERPGAIAADGTQRDISGLIADLAGEALSPASLARLAEADLMACPTVPDATRLGPCVGRVGNFIGVGLNYSDHAEEMGMAVPTEPLLFNKATSCISGPNDDIRIPRGSEKTDWEAELAVVIGRYAHDVAEDQAADFIAGYCICNDVSERSFQMDRGGQFMKGKGCPTFGPLGPWLVTRDEIADVQDCDIRLLLNGRIMQQGSTSKMLFSVNYLVSYISRFMALEPGDVITTGTPAGVGLAMKEPRYLKPGDIVELSVEGLGVQRQRLIAS